MPGKAAAPSQSTHHEPNPQIPLPPTPQCRPRTHQGRRGVGAPTPQAPNIRSEVARIVYGFGGFGRVAATRFGSGEPNAAGWCCGSACVMAAKGEQENRKQIVSFRMDADVVDAVRSIAHENERSLAGELRWLLRSYAENQ